jgi:hypothetical protein
LPAGHSSPAIWGPRIFLTAFDQPAGKLEVLCLSTKDGEILWRHATPGAPIESVHAVSNPATATPVVDDESVYAYFASYGVVALDHSGKERWSVALPPLKTTQGSGTSPVVHGDLLLLNRDAVENGSLLALDRRTGKLGLVEGYDLKNGRRVWWVKASTTGTSTVVTGSDAIYAATWSPLGEADQLSTPPDFATLVKENDRDGNGQSASPKLPPTLYLFSRPDVPNVPGASMAMSQA